MPRRPRDPGVPRTPVQHFGAELRAHRDLAGQSRAQLATKIGYSSVWIGQIENGKESPSKEFAQDCDTFFGTNGLFFRGWEWIQQVAELNLLPPGFPDFLEREAEAASMHIFETMVVTGLFQTPEYAYEVLKSGKKPEVVERLVVTRMERQQILDDEDPPHIVAIFDEFAIRRPIGDTETRRGQLQRLVELAQRPEITIQIVPAEAGGYPGLAGPFTIMGFADATNVVHEEGHHGAHHLNQPDAVRHFALQFDLIRGAAMSADDTLEMLRAILESL
ncbi:helix-turn-helix transcriptional regulator [Actinomadura kijaniata]|uniref:Transcriptional regulator with XRE-family HTH domain n=1 Tax=Actinomadura namibiensis TaxID=182080 RepID=A0A7W3QSE0_ACTNM|nr:helix-turn-helix transcriptional regulator [Actinomadura namibiensis]MBA8957552.1 transcriptional regulator with XRE-family HTH domain [Actinomadura namibiensis]